MQLQPSSLAVLLLSVLVPGPIWAADDAKPLETAFQQQVRPLLKQHCARCHNAEEMMSGIRVDHLDSAFDDRQLRLWQGIQRQVEQKTMPPEDQPQPTDAERRRLLEWISRGLSFARSRPQPRNGGARRLTVSQFRNTLRELLLLDDDLTDILPPDAVSRDGFLNNQETLQLSPLLLETYFEIAGRALDRCIVEPTSKPVIQNFRVDLGTAINPEPCPDRLILGANSLLLDNQDFRVTQLTPEKPFDFEPFSMRTKYRFIEGYQGNDTVRGWREYDSIYHAVFACMRGTDGYPKGSAYGTVGQGLLLRPAIPSAELFGVASTYGPRANFKISLRELPDHGRFRVTVTAAKYDDGLLLDRGAPSQVATTEGVVVCREPVTPQSVIIPQAGIYQVDVHTASLGEAPAAPDASRLADGLIGSWELNGDANGTPPREELVGRLTGDARFVSSPLGQAVSLDGQGDAVVIPRHESMSIGTGDFTVAAWIYPRQLRQAGIVCLGKYSWTHGWYLDMPNNQGVLRIETAGPDNQSNGTVASRPGVIRANAWQHVAAVVRRGQGETQVFVNGYPVAKGPIGSANLDNPKVDLHLGRIQDAQQFHGELKNVCIYHRALDEAELQALVEPGRAFASPPPDERPGNLSLVMGERQFTGTLHQPAFLAVRLAKGQLALSAQYTGAQRLDRIVLTPLPPDHDAARRFRTFEQRVPRLGVHLGLRRDCGSTLAQVGAVQAVATGEPMPYVFEGSISNFPSPDVEKDNVNYLAGVREIGVRSEYTDGRDMPRLLIRSVEFEGPFYETWPPEPHRRIFVEDAREDDLPVYARRVIREFASRAFRRPLTSEEEQTLIRVFDESFKSGSSFQQSVKDALLVVLTSPQFLFLIENSRTAAAEPLADYELASKLSYFLWDGPPDRALLDLASKDKLRDALSSQTERMIDDARFERFMEQFTSQWLALNKFDVLEPDRNRFPELTRDSRLHLRREPVEFLKHLVRKNLPVRNLIESDFVVANEVVASYYGLADKLESGFQFTAISRGQSELGGVLSQAAIMAGLSDGREGNPVKRGAWLARKIVAEARGDDRAALVAGAIGASPQPARLCPMPCKDRSLGFALGGI